MTFFSFGSKIWSVSRVSFVLAKFGHNLRSRWTEPYSRCSLTRTPQTRHPLEGTVFRLRAPEAILKKIRLKNHSSKRVGKQVRIKHRFPWRKRPWKPDLVDLSMQNFTCYRKQNEICTPESDDVISRKKQVDFPLWLFPPCFSSTCLSRAILKAQLIPVNCHTAWRPSRTCVVVLVLFTTLTQGYSAPTVNRFDHHQWNKCEKREKWDNLTHSPASNGLILFTNASRFNWKKKVLKPFRNFSISKCFSRIFGTI